MLGPQTVTTTAKQGGGLGGAIQGAIGTIVPYYMMNMMAKNQTAQKSNMLEQLRALAMVLNPEYKTVLGTTPLPSPGNRNPLDPNSITPQELMRALFATPEYNSNQTSFF